jgi:hypothetical protein
MLMSELLVGVQLILIRDSFLAERNSEKGTWDHVHKLLQNSGSEFLKGFRLKH